jgi:hypothetical protein
MRADMELTCLRARITLGRHIAFTMQAAEKNQARTAGGVKWKVQEAMV